MLGKLIKSLFELLEIIIKAILKPFKPIIKGWIGEKTLSLYLKLLPSAEYTVINNIILQTESGTTQIDHIVVSPYGVFVIETKNYKGWIFGGDRSSQWTQSLYGKKYRFMNPIHQNYAHVKAIESRLNQFPRVPIISIIAFSKGCKLKVKTTKHVVYYQKVVEVIRSYTQRGIDSEDVTTICSLLHNKNISSGITIKEHIHNVNNKRSEIKHLTVGDKCPRCSGTLVARHGKKGSFLGCNNFPKCRFTKESKRCI